MKTIKQTVSSRKAGHEEITGKVIGCAMRIHRVLGAGFSTTVYKHALAFELNKKGVKYECDKNLPVYYDGIKAGSLLVDFLLDGAIVVSISNEPLWSETMALSEAFLNAVNAEAGLALNFGSSRMDFATTFRSPG